MTSLAVAAWAALILLLIGNAFAGHHRRIRGNHYHRGVNSDFWTLFTWRTRFTRRTRLALRTHRFALKLANTRLTVVIVAAFGVTVFTVLTRLARLALRAFTLAQLAWFTSLIIIILTRLARFTCFARLTWFTYYFNRRFFDNYRSGRCCRQLAFDFIGAVDHRRTAQVHVGVKLDHLVDGARDDQVGEDGALAFVKGAPLPAGVDHACGADADDLLAALDGSGFDWAPFPAIADWRARILPLPQVFDASNPDLDRFKARGGKLLLLQGTTDMLVPTPMTTAYAESLARRYGDGLKDFARYYVVPGYGHGNGAFNMSWDSLAALDAWVEGGGAPVAPVAVDANADRGGRQRPLCEHPAWPKYRGSGDPGRSDSFDCVLR